MIWMNNRSLMKYVKKTSYGDDTEFEHAMYSLECFTSIVNRDILINNSSEYLLKKLMPNLGEESYYKKIKSLEQISDKDQLIKEVGVYTGYCNNPQYNGMGILGDDNP
jgi:hypothetical protein